VLNGTACASCDQLWANCSQCDNTTCTACLPGYTLNTTDCFLCGEAWSDCDTCNGTACLTCGWPYVLNATFCSPDCSLVGNCTTCEVLSGQLLCLSCSYALSLMDNACVPTCGDGLLTLGLEECDDNNTDNGDGCSSSCTVEDHFSCDNSITPS
jgi:cysteine-rich repeat protein